MKNNNYTTITWRGNGWEVEYNGHTIHIGWIKLNPGIVECIGDDPPRWKLLAQVPFDVFCRDGKVALEIKQGVCKYSFTELEGKIADNENNL